MAERLDGTWERSVRRKLWRRLTLRRADGEIYLDRWGIAHERVGGLFLHRMAAPDPGIDLHDHPWWFVAVALWGGYTEQRANIRHAAEMAAAAEHWDSTWRGVTEHRRPAEQ